MQGRIPPKANIDLGLAILASTSEPPHTARTIAGTVVVHGNAFSKLSKRLSANLGQHSTGTEYLAKRSRRSFKHYRRNKLPRGSKAAIARREWGHFVRPTICLMIDLSELPDSSDEKAASITLTALKLR